jgi:hypothetical protein
MNKKIESECCPKFIPEHWDEKEFTWHDKKFIKDKVFTLFYIPINFGAVMTRSFKKTEAAGSKIAEGLVLSEHTSKWNMNVYVAVDKEIPDSENMTISGKFHSKVYEGEYKDTGKWMKDFEAYAEKTCFSSKKMYMWYTTCPKCAKKYGKNYVVIMAKE